MVFPQFRRRSVRLPDYDYRLGGGYSVTICSSSNKCVFGKVRGDDMELSEIGKIVQSCWEELPKHFSNVVLDVFTILPNHVHGVIILKDVKPNLGTVPDVCRGTACCAPTTVSRTFGELASGSLLTIVRSFKSAVTNQVNKMRGTPAEPVWQRNYYEHIIRNEKDYQRIWFYTFHNVLDWKKDSLFRPSE